MIGTTWSKESDRGALELAGMRILGSKAQVMFAIIGKGNKHLGALFTRGELEQITGLSYKQVGRALDDLETARIIVERNGRRWLRLSARYWERGNVDSEHTNAGGFTAPARATTSAKPKADTPAPAATPVDTDGLRPSLVAAIRAMKEPGGAERRQRFMESMRDSNPEMYRRMQEDDQEAARLIAA